MEGDSRKYKPSSLARLRRNARNPETKKANDERKKEERQAKKRQKQAEEMEEKIAEVLAAAAEKTEETAEKMEVTAAETEQVAKKEKSLSMFWGIVTVRTLNVLRKEAGGRIPKELTEDWLSKNFEALQATAFQCAPSLGYDALYFLVEVGLDPYVGLDRWNSNFRFHFLRILLKIQKEKQLTPMEAAFMRAAVERHFRAGGRTRFQHEYVLMLRSSPKKDWPKRLSTSQREYFKKLEQLMLLAYDEKRFDTNSINDAKLQRGLDMLFIRVKDGKKTTLGGLECTPLVVLRPIAQNTPLPFVEQQPQAEFDLVLDEFREPTPKNPRKRINTAMITSLDGTRARIVEEMEETSNHHEGESVGLGGYHSDGEQIRKVGEGKGGEDFKLQDKKPFHLVEGMGKLVLEMNDPWLSGRKEVFSSDDESEEEVEFSSKRKLSAKQEAPRKKQKVPHEKQNPGDAVSMQLVLRGPRSTRPRSNIDEMIDNLSPLQGSI